MRRTATEQNLGGRTVVITRPVGMAAPLARRVRVAGGVPVLLPGMTLRGLDDTATRHALAQACTASWLIFTSPAAVRCATALQPLPDDVRAIGVGEGTRRALVRAGVPNADAPARQDSEGVLAMPALRDPQGLRIALVGAAGGRGLLASVLRERGAEVAPVHVYRRLPPRLDRRHHDAVRRLARDACVLWSSAEAIAQLRRQLPDDAWAHLCGTTAIVSSARLQTIAGHAGFDRIVLAHSARPADLVAAIPASRFTSS